MSNEPIAVNRSQAKRVAKLLYGPTARTWIREGAQVGTEKGDNKAFVVDGPTFGQALALPIYDYVMGASTYPDTKERIKAINGALSLRKREDVEKLQKLAEKALRQFPEAYDADLKSRESKLAKAVREAQERLRGQ